MSSSIGENRELICRARDGDGGALGELLALHRDRLRLMICLRLDPRLQGRIDPSDVLQEAYVEALERFDDYAAKPAMPFYLWLRFLTAQRLVTIYRRNLGAQVRDAGREISLYKDGSPEASSAVMAAELVGSHATPSHVAMRAETRHQLEKALEGMQPIDREILALRHWEELSNSEAAQVLELSESAASQRYGRALWRLKEILTDVLGESERGT